MIPLLFENKCCLSISKKHPSDPVPPVLDGYALQAGLERSLCDVLLLLNTCYAAGSVNSRRELAEGGQTEVIAACGSVGSNKKAWGPGPASFTLVLIQLLLEFSNPPKTFSASCLFRDIMSHIHQSAGTHATPVHFRLNGDISQPSI